MLHHKLIAHTKVYIYRTSFNHASNYGIAMYSAIQEDSLLKVTPYITEQTWPLRIIFFSQCGWSTIFVLDYAHLPFWCLYFWKWQFFSVCIKASPQIWNISESIVYSTIVSALSCIFRPAKGWKVCILYFPTYYTHFLRKICLCALFTGTDIRWLFSYMYAMVNRHDGMSSPLSLHPDVEFIR